jgi:hypothetical protein
VGRPCGVFALLPGGAESVGEKKPLADLASACLELDEADGVRE